MAGVVALLGATFVVLALLLRQAPGTAVDVAISRWVQSVDLPAFTSLMVAVSAPGYAPFSWIVVGGVAAGLLLLRLWREAVFVLATEGANLVTTYSKLLVERPRPGEDVVRVLSRLQDYSYPSGHVVGYVTVCGFLFFLLYTLARPFWWRTVGLVMLGFMVCSIGISRVHLGYHWASDVLGGYALGTAYLLVSIELYRLLVARRRAPATEGGAADDPETDQTARPM